MALDSSSSSSGGSSVLGSETTLAGLNGSRWDLEYEKGATEQWAKITLACALAVWVPLWLLWCYVVFYRKAEGGGFKVRFEYKRRVFFSDQVLQEQARGG